MPGRAVSACLLAATLAANLAVGATAPAFAGKSAPAGKASSAAPEAADPGLGMALMSAMVAANGFVIGGVGVVGVEHPGTGAYLVEFGRNLAGCTPLAGPMTGDGEAFTRVHNIPYGTPGTKFVVATQGANGVVADQAFTLMVFCAK